MTTSTARRGRGRALLAVLTLALAGGLSLASHIGSSLDEKYDQCCACLSRSHNDFQEPCIGVSTPQCVDTLVEGAPVASSSRCLRDLCAEACGEVVGEVTARADIEDCCACLVASHDPAGPACLQVDAEACVQSLDNGRSLASTQACFDEVCQGRCGFLSLRSAVDAGVGDAG